MEQIGIKNWLPKSKSNAQLNGENPITALITHNILPSLL